MAAVANPFRFVWGDYPARRLHPVSKLVVFLSLSLAAATARTPLLPCIAVATLGSLISAGAFRSGILEGLGALGRDGRFLLPLASFIVVFRVFDPWSKALFHPDELPHALLYVARLGLLFVLAETLFRSTSAQELAAAATHSFRRLTRREDLDPGLYLSLAICFIPRCFDAYIRSREAAFARGYGGRHGRSPRFRSSLLLLESFVASSIKDALSTAEALEVRGYSPGRSVPNLPFRSVDLALVLGSIAITALIAL
jgi:energy-coupling factor transporter transmembrane protein EcfT